MARGKVKGEVTQAFQDRVADLQQKAKEQSEQLRYNNTPRPWHTPNSMADKNLLDVANLHEPAWNRDDANARYSNEVLNYSGEPGTAGDLASLKKQIDFMAVEERAWRLRHASLARCVTLAHGRLEAHGKDYGIFAAVQNVVENHLKEGAGAPDKAGSTVT